MVSAEIRRERRIRAELVGRVRARQGELEWAIMARIREVAPAPADGEDAEYLAGLRGAVTASLEYSLEGIELGEAAPQVPPEALAQAQRAARAGVSLDTVLRRYVLGSTLVGDYLMQEAARGGLPEQAAVLREALNEQAAVLDRMLGAITGEYALALEQLRRSPEQRRAERVQRLLAGECCGDAIELDYDLDGWHLGAIAGGHAPVQLLRGIACTLQVRLLCIARGEHTAWGWLGARRELASEQVEHALAAEAAREHTQLALGEPAQGIEGWRLTHHQAQAALRVALRDSRPVTRYLDVALLAAALADHTLCRSLVEIHLAPLGEKRNGGAMTRETLRAYFTAESNASSAASALGVDRHTVENRLRAIEQKLGCTLRARQAELEVALRLEELGAADAQPRPRRG